jgi:hypothetical protein
MLQPACSMIATSTARWCSHRPQCGRTHIQQGHMWLAWFERLHGCNLSATHRQPPTQYHAAQLHVSTHTRTHLQQVERVLELVVPDALVAAGVHLGKQVAPLLIDQPDVKVVQQRTKLCSTQRNGTQLLWLWVSMHTYNSWRCLTRFNVHNISTGCSPAPIISVYWGIALGHSPGA